METITGEILGVGKRRTRVEEEENEPGENQREKTKFDSHSKLKKNVSYKGLYRRAD